MPPQARSYLGKVSDWSRLDFGWMSFDLSLISVPQASPISSSLYHYWSRHPGYLIPFFVPMANASQIYNSLVRNTGPLMDVPARTTHLGEAETSAISDAPHHGLLGVPSHYLLIHVTNVPTMENRSLCSCCSLLDWQPRTSKWWTETKIIFQDRKPEVKMCVDASSHSTEGVQSMMEMGRPSLA